jgi:hypothetical protein
MDRRTARREAFLTALEGGHTRTTAAGMAGVRRETAWRWMESPDFARRAAAAEAKFVDSMLAVIRRDAARNAPRSPSTALDLLGRRNREYRPGLNIESDDASPWTPDELAVLRAARNALALSPAEREQQRDELARLLAAEAADDAALKRPA